MKRLMVLGGNPFQAPLARIGKDLHYEVAVIDQDKNCPGKQHADVFYELSISDKDACLEAAFEFRPDGVCTAGTDFTTTVSWICEGLGLPSNRFVPYETAYEMSNKYVMRQCLGAAGITQPLPYELDYTRMAMNPPPFPMIVKPCQSMGARGVSICDTVDQVLDAVRRAQSADPKGEAIVEPYIDADKFLSVDSMWLDGRLVFLSIADRLIVNHGPYPIELGHDVPASLTYSEYSLVKYTMIQVSKAFCYRTGFIKGDLMLKDGKCYVGEVAARVSGSFNSGRTVPLTTGFPLHDAVVKVAMGEDYLRDLFARCEGMGVASERTLVAHRTGTVRKVDVSALSRIEPYPDTVHIWVKEGDYVHEPWSNMDKVANVVCWAKRREEAVGRATRALNAIRVEIE